MCQGLTGMEMGSVHDSTLATEADKGQRVLLATHTTDLVANSQTADMLELFGILDLGLTLTTCHGFRSSMPPRTRRVVRSCQCPILSNAYLFFNVWCVQCDAMRSTSPGTTTTPAQTTKPPRW